MGGRRGGESAKSCLEADNIESGLEVRGRAEEEEEEVPPRAKGVALRWPWEEEEVSSVCWGGEYRSEREGERGGEMDHARGAGGLGAEEEAIVKKRKDPGGVGVNG